MRLKSIKKIENEEGFWSSLLILFLVTLVLLGFGSFVLVRSESANVANQIRALQADYAANGCAYYGIKRLQLGSLNESETLTVGNGFVSLDTSEVSGSLDILLNISGTVGGVERKIEIRLATGGGLVDKAIYTMGDVFNVTGKDSLGNPSSDVVVTQADTVPEIDVDSLNTMSTAQGHDQSGTPFTPVDGYPNGSFYQPDGVTPNVTHVMDSLVVEGGRTIFGIFVVEGSVILHGSSRVQGVIYLPNPTSTIITGGGNPGESSITGGIVSHGNISGFGNHISVRHQPEFMRAFCEFQIGPDPDDSGVVSWLWKVN